MRLLENREDMKINLGQIGIGIKNQHLRCTNGPCKDKSIRLAHVADGQKIGSFDGEDLANDSDNDNEETKEDQVMN